MMTTRAGIRLGLVVLAAFQAFLGGWALFAPRSFFDNFPMPGHEWVVLLPPYNEHLVRDVGGFSLAVTLVLAAAAVTMDRLLVRVALVALSVFAVPHAIFHAAHLEGFPTSDAVAQTMGIVVQLLLTLALFALTWRLPASGRDQAARTRNLPE